MIKHIVFWKLKEEAEGRDKLGNAAEMKLRLEALRGKVPTVRVLEVGAQMEPNEAAYDLALYSEFADRAGLAAYLDHPEHVKVVEFVRKVVSDRKVVDYEI